MKSVKKNFLRTDWAHLNIVQMDGMGYYGNLFQWCRSLRRRRILKFW